MKTTKKEQAKLSPLAVTPERLPELFPGLNVGELANKRSEGKGPKYYKQGRRIFYKISDVEA